VLAAPQVLNWDSQNSGEAPKILKLIINCKDVNTHEYNKVFNLQLDENNMYEVMSTHSQNALPPFFVTPASYTLGLILAINSANGSTATPPISDNLLFDDGDRPNSLRPSRISFQAF